MTIKSKISINDFNKILAEYNLGKYVNSGAFTKGSVQTNTLLRTTKGNYVLRYYENRSEKYAMFEVNILQFLAKHSYPCPIPIKNISGNFIGKYRNKPFAIFRFMNGSHRKNVDPRLIAAAIGRLHKITYQYRPKYFEYRDTFDIKSCLRNALLNSEKIRSKSESKKRLEWLKSELRKLEIPKSLPKGVCHCDTHPSNFLYKNGRLVAVLDFDDASYVYLIYDLANMIYFWAWPDKKYIMFDKAKELLKEYNKHRKLTEIEKTHLFDILKMAIFMSIGWFIHENDFYNDKRKIELLNSIGKEEFYNRIFV